jgi:antitoxin ChpS
MHTTNLRKVGGSVMLAVPPPLLKVLELHVGSLVGVAVDHGRLVIDPSPRPHYSLDELLAQCEASAKISVEDQAWLDNEPVGKELL